MMVHIPVSIIREVELWVVNDISVEESDTGVEKTDCTLNEKVLLLLWLKELNMFIVLELALQPNPESRLLIGLQIIDVDGRGAVPPELLQKSGKFTTIFPPAKTLFEGFTVTFIVPKVLTTLGVKLILQPK